MGGHPYLGDGDPQALLSSLDRLEGLGAHVCVPGHGPVGESEDVERMGLYLRTLMQQVQEVVAHGGTEDEAAMQPVPEAFARWMLAKPFYEANMRFLFDRVRDA
ncbi:MAG: hypothetical protein ACE5QF_06520 [Thermoplasmata archaeon]